MRSTHRVEPQHACRIRNASARGARSTSCHESMHAEPADAAVGKNIETNVRDRTGLAQAAREEVAVMRSQPRPRQNLSPAIGRYRVSGSGGCKASFDRCGLRLVAFEVI